MISNGRYLRFKSRDHRKVRTTLALHSLESALKGQYDEGSDDEHDHRDTAVYINHDINVLDFAWSSDGNRFASLTASCLSIFNKSGARLKQWPLAGVIDVPRSFGWSPGDSKIAVMADAELCILTLVGRGNSLECLSVSYTTQWPPLTTSQVPAPILKKPAHDTYSSPAAPRVAWSPDGQRILCVANSKMSIFDAGGDDDSILASEIRTVRPFMGYSGGERINTARWSPDSLRIAMAGGDNCGHDIAIKVYDVEHVNMAVVGSWSGEMTDGADNAVWFDNKTLVCAINYGEVRST